MQTYLKDPDAILDYKIDWTAWLDTDTITSSTWIIPTGISSSSDSFDNHTTTVWLSGGTIGSQYKLVNRVTTTAGRTDDRTITIAVRER